MMQSELSSDDMALMSTSFVLGHSAVVTLEVVFSLSGLLVISGKSGSPSVFKKCYYK